MNKHLHRIVFNAARGTRMVVQETARSAGKAGSGATGAVLSAAALASALISAPLHAQIVADPGAPGRQRPTVLVAPNGVPLVNIQTPSAAGVSRNTYSQFDVQRNGAVLNNSRVNVQTQLGGWVQGNPWLATGSARVILNEVNSANPSQLRGYLMGGAGAATGVKVFGAGVGALANYAFQSGGQPTDWIDVGIAGGTGFLTSGLGPGSSVMINTGGSLLGSGIQGSRARTRMRGWVRRPSGPWWATGLAPHRWLSSPATLSCWWSRRDLGRRQHAARAGGAGGPAAAREVLTPAAASTPKLRL